MKRCKECNRPIRPCGHKAADHPGTVPHKGRGLCITCWQHSAERPWPVKRKKQPITGEADPSTLRSLSAYLAWRAPFRAKADAQ